MLANKNGLEARITNYGGILVSLKAPDRNGKLANVQFARTQRQATLLQLLTD